MQTKQKCDRRPYCERFISISFPNSNIFRIFPEHSWPYGCHPYLSNIANLIYLHLFNRLLFHP